jgi:hypothetical protein
MSSKQRPVVVRRRNHRFAGCLPSTQIALNRRHAHHLTTGNPFRRGGRGAAASRGDDPAGA